MNNVLIAVGRITKDVELRSTKSGKPVASVNIAINNGKDDTTFIRIDCFNTMAETIHKYCKKGDLIGCQAMVRNNVWTDKNNEKHYDYIFLANKITFLQSKPKETSDTKPSQEQPIEEKNDPYAEFGQEVEITDDMLPF